MSITEGFSVPAGGVTAEQRTAAARRPGRTALRVGAGALSAALLLEACSTGGGSGTAEATPTGTASGQPNKYALLPGESHEEIVQFPNAELFADPHRMAGVSRLTLSVGKRVAVDCVETNIPKEATTAKGGLYHLIGPADVGGLYVAANLFENGDATGPLEDQPVVDPAVKECPDVVSRPTEATPTQS